MPTSLGEQAQRALIDNAVTDIVLADLINANLGGLAYLDDLRTKTAGLRAGIHGDKIGPLVDAKIAALEVYIRGV